jgi:DNA-binding transcriptional LysR family regulator
MSKFDPRDMQLFASVVDAGSQSAASRATNVPKSTISRCIARLERQLQATLIDRSAHAFTITEAGHLFHGYCRQVRLAIEDAEAAVDDLQGHVRGTLRIGASVTVGQTLLSHLLPEFVARHSGLRIALELTNRALEPRPEGFDVVIKAGAPPDARVVARTLGEVRYGIYASPAYLKTFGLPSTPEDLDGAHVVDNFEGNASMSWWLRSGNARKELRVQSRLDFNDAIMRRDVVMRGAGIGMLPDSICREALRSNTLVAVLPEWAPERAATVYAIWPGRSHMTSRLRVFLDFLTQHAPRILSA